MTTQVQEDNQTIAVRLLASLRGYTQRQAWGVQDAQILVEILDEWDRQVADLEAQLKQLHHNFDALDEQHRSLQAENEELRATSGLKGVMTYLRTRSGL